MIKTLSLSNIILAPSSYQSGFLPDVAVSFEVFQRILGPMGRETERMCVDAYICLCVMAVFSRRVWFQDPRNEQHMQQHVDVNLNENNLIFDNRKHLFILHK